MATLRRITVLTAFLAVAMLVGCKKSDQVPSASGPNDQAEEGAQAGSITIRHAVLPSILLEAEAGKIQAPMALYNDDPAASGGAYVLAPEGPNHEKMSEGGGVTLKFESPASGEYTLWVRGNWCCDCGNSAELMLDGGELGVVEDATLGAWHWTPLRKRISLSAGPHLLAVLNREDGAKVDQVLLTRDEDYRPVDVELPDVPGRVSPVIEIAGPVPVEPGVDESVVEQGEEEQVAEEVVPVTPPAANDTAPQ
jgi:hypothetical protein